MKILFAAVLLCSVSAAQSIPKAHSSQAGKTIGLTNLLGSVESMKCIRLKRPITGTVLKRDYDDDEATIASIVFRLPNDKRKFLNLNANQVGVFGHRANSLIDGVFSVGIRLKVTTAECSGGGSGVFTYVDSAFIITK